MTLAHRIRFTMTLNAREAMHLIELRSQPQGHESYRAVAQEMHRQIAEVAGHRAIAAMMSFVDTSGPGARAPRGRAAPGGAPGEPVSGRRRIASGSPFEASIGFSRAVRVGDRVLVSGTAPVWPDGSCDPDPAVQADRCLEIIAAALADAGAAMADVVRTRMLLVDAADADAVAAVHGEAFGDVAPGGHDGRGRGSPRPAVARRDRGRGRGGGRGATLVT